jgi:APA family basic amino acid/polyamine antiporter
MAGSKQLRLKRTLGLFDAVSIGLGAIIGAGIFVALGIAAGLAGPGLLLSVIIAGIVASFTALSFAELSSAIPKEGGAYEYVFEVVSPSLGFLTGWMWLFGQIVTGAAVSLGLAAYLALFVPIPLKLIAVSACLLFMLVNLIGVKQSGLVNDALVVLKIAALCVFVIVGVFHVQASNFSPLFPNGFSGVINGAALIFFAYLGFGRIATVSEEVKNAGKRIPLSILLALGISTLLYLLVSFTAVGVVGYAKLSASGSPLADAMGATGNDLATWVVSIGGILATASVLLTTILGVSRVSFSMARNKQVPGFINALHPRFGTPYISILVTGLLMAFLAFAWDLKQVFSLASFSVIVTHVLVNYSALKLGKDKRRFRVPFSPIPQLLGIVSCLILAFSLLPETWVMASGVLAVGVIVYLLERR